MSSSQTEIQAGERFAFGTNWRSYVKLVDEARIAAAVESLVAALGTQELTGRSFLDIGGGSRLFSLAAHRLGARAATTELRERFAPRQRLGHRTGLRAR